LAQTYIYMSFFEVLILSLIEGLTEFIPVSSTGHLIIVSALMQMEPTDFHKAFEVIIQFGAILAVIYLYKSRLKWDFNFYKNVTLAFLPTAIIGFLLKDKINILLESTIVVAISLIVGGVVLIFIDSLLQNQKESELTTKSSLAIGICQSIAMIPGVSRSAASIIGGRIFGLSREKAAEFSFILAIPTLGAATAYKLWKIRDLIDASNSSSLILGIFFSFIFSVLAIKFFITFVNKYGFKYFGYYRIAVGLIVLGLQMKGIIR
jgi:undecaprenyl-diphosphatase